MQLMLQKIRPEWQLSESESGSATSYVPIRCAGELGRVEKALRRLSAFCVRLQMGARGGLCIASLRKALQASEEICGRSAEGPRLSQHELDNLLTSAATRRGGAAAGGGAVQLQAAPAAYTQLPVLTAFTILQECAHRCCEKGVTAAAAAANFSALDRLEWLLEAISAAAPSGAVTGSSQPSCASGYSCASSLQGGRGTQTAFSSPSRCRRATPGVPGPLQRTGQKPTGILNPSPVGPTTGSQLGYTAPSAPLCSAA